MAERVAPNLPEQHPEHYEHRDANVRGLWIFIGVFIAVAVCIHLGLYGLTAILSHYNGDWTPVHVIPGATGPISPEPRIQGIQGYHENVPPGDMEAFLKQEQAELSSYGPTTQPGFVRIPVDRAMELALSSGMFKSQPQPTTQPLPQTPGPLAWPSTTQPGGGRGFRRGPGGTSEAPERKGQE